MHWYNFVTSITEYTNMEEEKRFDLIKEVLANPRSQKDEVQALQEGLFEKLASSEAEMITQLREALPSLAVELARRLLAGPRPRSGLELETGGLQNGPIDHAG